MTSNPYPTWQCTRPGKRWESVEQLNGVPDFIIEKVSTGWRLRWRTSKVSEVFEKLVDAKDSVARSLWTGRV